MILRACIFLLVISSSLFSSGEFYIDLYSNYPCEPPPIPWKHISKLKVVKNRYLVGYHWQGDTSFGQLELSNLKKPDIFGIYKATVHYKGMTKISTFFPISWSKSDIRDFIKEAYLCELYRNDNKNQYGFVGQTKLGMRCQFWFQEDDKGNIYIASVYPRGLSINEFVQLYHENDLFKAFVDARNDTKYDLSVEHERKKFFRSFY